MAIINIMFILILIVLGYGVFLKLNRSVFASWLVLIDFHFFFKAIELLLGVSAAFQSFSVIKTIQL